MRANNTVWQWLALATLLLLALLILVWFRLSEVERYKSVNEIKFKVNDWQSPVAQASNSQDFVISRQQWTFDFTQAEKILVQMPLDKQGQLAVNEKTAALIEQMLNALGTLNGERALTRLTTLIHKGFPAPASEDLAKLTLQYNDYLKDREEATDKKNKPLAEAIRQQYRLQSLQVARFGEQNAQKLFGRKNRTNNYLLARLKIINDKTLERSEKNDRLNTLTEQFRNDDSAFLKAVDLEPNE